MWTFVFERQPSLILSYFQRTTKGAKAMERMRKKLSEQESLLLLMSPTMAFRVANRNGKVRQPTELGLASFSYSPVLSLSLYLPAGSYVVWSVILFGGLLPSTGAVMWYSLSPEGFGL